MMYEKNKKYWAEGVTEKGRNPFLVIIIPNLDGLDHSES
jgi:hypothetical protein